MTERQRALIVGQSPGLTPILTHEEVGALMGGVCKEWVRQIETRALRKLRRIMEREGYTFDSLRDREFRVRLRAKR